MFYSFTLKIRVDRLGRVRILSPLDNMQPLEIVTIVIGLLIVILLTFAVAVYLKDEKVSGSVSPELPKPASTEEMQTWSYLTDWDFPGNDLGQPIPNVTGQQCQKLCSNNESCVAGDYSTNLQVCWLKNSLTTDSPIMPGGRHVYMKPPKESKLKKVPSTALTGSDLFTIYAPTGSSCQLLCEHNGNCRGATYYHGDGSRRCKLYRQLDKNQTNMNADSFVVI